MENKDIHGIPLTRNKDTQLTVAEIKLHGQNLLQKP